MTTAPHAIEYPVIGISRPLPEKRYVFVGRTYYELREVPLHSYIRGMTRDQVFVSADGKVYKVIHANLSGLDWVRISEVGYVTSLIASIFSLFNIPILIDFELVEAGDISLDEIKEEIRMAFCDFPKAYFRFKDERAVRRRVDHAKSFLAIADAIS
ncbi:hypothetical protein [Vandammella animalimorsus]|uniref:hypothetical protein n=1 Tax=Vandammella animalimorsus TaxID=2029117 RepID=UPI0011C4090F|nr:hypothetical protein [Vandammella animalimorsus]